MERYGNQHAMLLIRQNPINLFNAAHGTPYYRNDKSLILCRIHLAYISIRCVSWLHNSRAFKWSLLDYIAWNFKRASNPGAFWRINTAFNGIRCCPNQLIPKSWCTWAAEHLFTTLRFIIRLCWQASFALETETTGYDLTGAHVTLHLWVPLINYAASMSNVASNVFVSLFPGSFRNYDLKRPLEQQLDGFCPRLQLVSVGLL